MRIKDADSTNWLVITADQRNSRRSADQVPEALRALDHAVGSRMTLAFERTAGDEIQGLTDDPEAAVDAVLVLTRLPDWHIGIGVGPVELPLPESTREARGPAYVAARAAVEQARNAPANLRLQVADSVTSAPYGDNVAQQAETALVLLRALVNRRTPEGWEIMDVLETAGSGKQAAAALGISPSAVSQRLSRAARAESERGTQLAVQLLARALGA